MTKPKLCPKCGSALKLEHRPVYSPYRDGDTVYQRPTGRRAIEVCTSSDCDYEGDANLDVTMH